MAAPASLSPEKKHWWLSNNKVVERYVKEARSMMATQEAAKVSAALGMAEAALALSPRLEAAIELKGRALLALRRYREVADMLQDLIPSAAARAAAEEDSGASLSAASDGLLLLSREHAKLLSRAAAAEDEGDGDSSFPCFSVSDIKRRVMAGLRLRSPEPEGLWRYLVLGQACCHLGLMDDSMSLLQTWRRLASAAFRRESVSWPEDNFSSASSVAAAAASSSRSASFPPPSNLTSSSSSSASEWVSAAQLLSHVKLLIRRRTAAHAALDAGLPSESIRHFSKILDGRRGVPRPFAAACLIGRATALRAAGRLSEAIADCNLALALDPASIPALRARADLLESVRSLPDCLQDLDHLKLLYDSILRDGKLPGPVWRPHGDVRYRDIPGSHRALTARIQQLRQRLAAAGGVGNVDYHALVGVRRGCTRPELERAHVLISLRHRPDKAVGFVERVDFSDDHRSTEEVRDQARMSALILYRLLQKGRSSIVTAIAQDEAAEKQRIKEAAAVAVAAVAAVESRPPPSPPRCECVSAAAAAAAAKAVESVFQGVFCRDMAVVGSLLSQVGFNNRPIPVKYEALSC